MESLANCGGFERKRPPDVEVVPLREIAPFREVDRFSGRIPFDTNQ